MEENGKTIKVLLVDDSSFVQKMLESMLLNAPGISIVGAASNGLEALEKIRELSPDVVTLDVDMPRMNGLETIRAIMSLPTPIPCIMVSSLTTEGAQTTFAALDEGAVDFIAKPSAFLRNDMARMQAELVSKITVASRISPLALKRKISFLKDIVPPAKSPQILKRGIQVVLIGISTGGPPALQRIIPLLPADFPAAVVVAQHMPLGFTKSMATRLNEHSKIEVKESEEGDVIMPGRVLIAKSGKHLVFKEKGGSMMAHLTSMPDDGMYYPNISVLFSAAAETFGDKALPIIMTGMGNDGVAGLRKLKEKNAFSMAQSVESCVVSSMPKAAIEAQLIDRVVDLGEMVAAIMEEI
jgi:two-component system chemotaxis response regulator CheB